MTLLIGSIRCEHILLSMVVCCEVKNGYKNWGYCVIPYFVTFDEIDNYLEGFNFKALSKVSRLFFSDLPLILFQ